MTARYVFGHVKNCGAITYGTYASFPNDPINPPNNWYNLKIEVRDNKNVKVRRIRVRGGNFKFRALRLDIGNFYWQSEGISRKTKITNVVYNASSNELVRTNTLVKNAIVYIDDTPFKNWYLKHYGIQLGKK